MENLTHSLLGAILADAIVPADATPRQRTAFYVGGIIAANLPDADLLYSSILPSPLGYLLHHRGHTHTIAGLIALWLLSVAALTVPVVRRMLGHTTKRFLIVIAVALVSHLLADSWNSYGVHPFYPLDDSWYYGDTIYILEPWLWVLLGVPLALNVRRPATKLLLALALTALPIIGAAVGVIARGAILPLFIAAGIVALVLRAHTRRWRAVASLVLAGGFVVFSFAMHARALAAAERAIAASGLSELDVVLNPAPANPLCWSALTVSDTRGADTIVYRRGTIALAHRRLGVDACGAGAGAATSWSEEVRQPARALTALAANDCWVRAWLQFGRAPVLAGDRLADLRFGEASRANFTTLIVARGARACPRPLTPWDYPRRDVLEKRN
jgi:inner membrane protein